VNRRVSKWKRWFKYKYLKLLRVKGGPQKTAKGFSIGIAVEMFTLPTGGLAFFLIFPLAYLFRGSMAGALIGFMLGKVIYIPMAFLIKKIGDLVIPDYIQVYFLDSMPTWLSKIIEGSLDLIVGGIIVGTVLGIVVYYPIFLLLKTQINIRKEKRLKRIRIRPTNKSSY
jgi:uncharacterized protein (DUF2062 family)